MAGVGVKSSSAAPASAVVVGRGLGLVVRSASPLRGGVADDGPISLYDLGVTVVAGTDVVTVAAVVVGAGAAVVVGAGAAVVAGAAGGVLSAPHPVAAPMTARTPNVVPISFVLRIIREPPELAFVARLAAVGGVTAEIGLGSRLTGRPRPCAPGISDGRSIISTPAQPIWSG